MTKTKVMVAIGVTTLVVGLSGGGFYYQYSRYHQSAVSFGDATATASASTAVPVDPTKSAANSISLNQNFDTP